jgi:cystathionine gamma-synthase
MLFPSRRCAMRCIEFLCEQNPQADHVRIRQLDFVPHPDKIPADESQKILPRLSAVIYPSELWPTAKTFWQHAGDGISSRRADFCQKAFDENFMVERSAARESPPRMTKGPRRYQRNTSVDITKNHAKAADETAAASEDTAPEAGIQDLAQFVEERFGRNLNMEFATQAKLAIRKRIAGSLTVDIDIPESLEHPSDPARERSRDVPGFSVDDVYLHSCGMNAIFTAHRVMRLARGEMKSIMYGFPYVDTLKILEKWGPGALFYGMSSQPELDDLEKRLEAGERYLAVFCEFPGNPLLRSPNLKRIRQLADKYDFGIVVDETIGNFLNIHVLPYADVVVSSLTKIFSGDSNVMGGAMILNPQSRYYTALKNVLAEEYEDNQFEEDSVYLERNSRDFVSRLNRINHNAEAIADTLRSHPRIKQVNYPKYGDTKAYYDACKAPGGGYGGLLSCTFHSMEDAATFYDHLNTQKGPSLGTNFTLSSPFVILAHFTELEWAASYGCEASLVRFSIGLEETEALKGVFEYALAAIGKGEES